MPKRNPLLVALGSLLLLGACSKHADQLRASGQREISGEVVFVSKDHPKFKLAAVSIVVADLDECIRNVRQLRDKHPIGPERDKLTPKDYWDVLGTAEVRAKTDADGKFKVLVPANKKLLLCAYTLQGPPGAGVVPYVWMIRLDENPVQFYQLLNGNHMPDARAVEDLLLL